GAPAAARTPAPALRDEVLGFGIGSALLQQLDALKPQHFRGLPADRLFTLVSPQALVTVPGQARALEHHFDWTAEEALNTALVPNAVLQTLAQHIEEFAA